MPAVKAAASVVAVDALPWHRRLEARVSAALALLVAAALGAVVLATLRVVNAQSEDRVAAELHMARSVLQGVVDLRLDALTDLAELAAASPGMRGLVAWPTRQAGAAAAAAQRAPTHADFVVIADTAGTWLGTAGWTDPTGSAASVIRDAQHRALSGKSTGALVPRGSDLYLSSAVPVRQDGRVAGTLIVGSRVTDDVVREMARLARVDLALVVHGRPVAASFDSGAAIDADELARATMTSDGVRDDALTLGGRKFVAGVFPLERDLPGGDGVQLLVLSDWASTQRFLDGLSVRFAVAGLVALAVSLAGGVLLSRHLSRPLRDIATAATEIAGGNLARQLAERGTAEAVTVARAFNAMSVSLRTAHDRLVHDAIHDHLTQLPNRAHFKDRLDRALARRARRKDYQFAVLFVDLDRFKHVNDSLGHTAGDRLLMMFAERLASAVRAEDVVSRMPGAATVPEPTLARFGGDEFAVLLDAIRAPIDAVRVAERVQDAASQPLSLDGQDVFTTASIGVAVATDAHRSGEDIIRDADLAMYRAKHSGGGYAVFDAALHEEAVRRLRLETDLRRAVDRREFVVWYQPVVSLDTFATVGVEALARWQHPVRGLVMPGEFFDVAEEVGLITQIDEWVLAESCRQAAAWRCAGAVPETFSVSVNLSARAFAQEALVQRVTSILRETGCPPSWLRLEITEGAAIKDPARARTVLAHLRRLGVRISLDDFGTGYSSLSYLQALPLDVLKIDRSFVTGIGTDEDKREIVKLVVGLSRTLGLEIVAEGTETVEQVTYLRELGCQCGQGYYFARPTAPPADGPPPIQVPARRASGTGRRPAVATA